MKKQLNIALLPAAVAAALLSGNVMAGTESCFETWSQLGEQVDGTATLGASNAVDAYAHVFMSAGCTGATELSALDDILDPASAAVGLIKPTTPPSIASEITKSFIAPGHSAYTGNANDFENYDNTADNLVAITYIPTTELPAATRITMKLSGAHFGTKNANNLFLLKSDGTNFVKVASSDGVFNDISEVLFVVGNEPVPAGTRLILTTDQTKPMPVSYALTNDACNATGDVTLKVTSATNGVDSIAGGFGSEITLATIKQQYGLAFGQDAAAFTYADLSVDLAGAQADDVDAATESNSRETFVKAGVDADNKTSVSRVYLYDTQPTYATTTAPTLKFKATTDSAAGDGVVFNVIDNAGTALTFGGTSADLAFDGAELETPTLTALTADEVVANASLSFVVKNLVTDGASEVMNFNYAVNLENYLELDNSALNNGCVTTPVTHDIGVNGAVLKVPYMRTVANDQWIKITNESNTAASILVDVFNDKATEEEVNGVNLGPIAAKETKLFYGSELLEAAVADGYGAGDESTHTMTFVVTAPESSVHGVSVQTVPNKGDRVQPVLRADTDADGKRAWSW